MRYPDATPPTYYPGVASRASARAIDLRPDEKKNAVDLTLLPPRAFRVVKVHIRWPDGSTPNGAAIDAWVNQGIYVSDDAPENGVFELRLLEGVDYWLTAAALDESRKPSRFTRGTWVYAENYRLPAGSDAVEVQLTAKFEEPRWFKVIYPAVNK